jgi:hypothetical protein
MRNPDFQDGVAFLVSVKDLGKRVRVNVTLTEQRLREIDRHARAREMTRSAFLVKAGLQVVDAG